MESPARASPLSAIDGAGVDFISVKESYLDTSGPFRELYSATWRSQQTGEDPSRPI